MYEAFHPTAWPEVNTVLGDFLLQIQAILGHHFVGMYLYGSLALGDFNPRWSDIDFMVVTNTDLNDELCAELDTLHSRFATTGSSWAAKIEAAYIPLAALRGAALLDALYPQIEHGHAFAKAPLELGWPVQCHTLREQGIVVAGPHPHTLIPPVDRHDLCRSGASIAGMWHDAVLHDPEWLEWLRDGENSAFVVLTLCRILCTVETGTIVSKPAAGRWALQTLGDRWAALIEGALAWSNAHHDTTSYGAIDVTCDLIAYTMDRCRQSGPSMPPIIRSE